ncbi:hypothetical protein [Fusobacterium hominis]|uniref:Uncharacterized protein n=1 Tax=Fusobacterium hominis TaxID=2764326 RepID=A0A7G9GZA0_9FUSO|nr:hypothetical protein [Fusobacterium hominis]QNM16132.1 hypothetical protein H9Q81_04790 [Fusobacterium hominis]
MEIKDNEILQFSREAILQVLRKLNTKIEELKKNDEISAIEILQRDVVSKYEKLFKGLNNEISDDEKDENKLQNIKKYILDILHDNGITTEFIFEQMKLRQELKGNSGAEVVKNLFEYEKKELTKKKYDLLDRVNKVLDEEEKLAMDLKNAIQEEEQMECIYKLQPVREKYRELEEKVMNVQKKLEDVDKKINSIWEYEIYGTIPKEEMLKAFHDTIKK